MSKHYKNLLLKGRNYNPSWQKLVRASSPLLSSGELRASAAWAPGHLPCRLPGRQDRVGCCGTVVAQPGAWHHSWGSSRCVPTSASLWVSHCWSPRVQLPCRGFGLASTKPCFWGRDEWGALRGKGFLSLLLLVSLCHFPGRPATIYFLQIRQEEITNLGMKSPSHPTHTCISPWGTWEK